MQDICTVSANSISALRRETAQPWKNSVLKYLRNGKEIAAAPAAPCDVISGERINKPLVYMTDGVFGWRSDVIYYVEKYNLELDSDFVNRVLAKS